MFFKVFISTGLCLAAYLPLTSALTITGPNTNAYWVYGVNNTITWTYNANDPSPISVFITNANSSTLNGPFAIAENVPASQQSIEVTQVTLRPGSGYVVNFVNTTNATDVYATSNTFTVDPEGSLPYSDTVVTTTATSISGTVARTYTLTETSSAAPTSGSGGSTNATGTGTGSGTTTTGSGSATATVVQKGGAGSTRPADRTVLLVGILGALVGSAMLL